MVEGQRARRSLHGFGRDQRGVTAVEFGFVAVPFLGLMMAIFQFGLFFFATEGLQAAVQDAARQLYTGRAQGAGVSTASAFLTDYVCPARGPSKLPSFIDCSKLIVDVRVASSFGSIDTGVDFYRATASRQFCAGGPRDIVVVRVIYPLAMLAPIVTGFGSSINVLQAGFVNDVPNNPGLKQLVLATSVFKNEPYASASSNAC